MKRWVLFVSLVLILVFTSIGCASSATVKSTAYPGMMTAPPTRTAAAYPGSAPAPTTKVTMYDYSSKGGDNGVQSSNETWSSVNTYPATTVDRMVIRTGNMQIVVKDIQGSLENIVKVAADNGGYVVTSSQWKEGERNVASISIRILAENYDKTLAAVRSMAISVTQESTSSQDVTEEYTDLSSKLKNLEATEAQLLKIMETATKVEDVLAVQRELTTVRGDIEQTKGRMLYIERTTSTSLLTIQMNESVFGLKFSADKMQVNTNEKVTFTPIIDGGFAPFSYIWDFGDGEQSTEAAPQHAYTRGGVYSVVLIVTDDKGYNNQLVRSNYINVRTTWNPGNAASSAWSALGVFVRWFVDVLIRILAWAPVWIVIGGIVWLIIYLKRRKARKSSDKNPKS
jgi:PKD repeat protein